MWQCVFLICFGGTPIFDAQEDNAWGALRDAFYTHKFTNGQVYEHEESLDHPPWSNWVRFYNDEQFHSRVLALLDNFLELPKKEVEDQPAIRRAILLRDLWPVFDAQAEGDTQVRFEGEGDASGTTPAARRGALRERVAKVMRRLELSEAEVAQLPDNYRALIETKLYLPAFDPKSPDKGFIPSDLFDETGPWVPIARAKKTPGGLGHLQGVRYRSIFVPYIRVSDNRQETLDFLNKSRRRPIPVPKGTLLALVRRMALPTTSGRMVEAPIMESLQLIVVDPPRDHHFKFVMDRRALIAGEPGLRQLTNDDPVDAYSFESGGLFGFEIKKDSDGEQLVLGKYAGPLPKGFTSLGHCIACHGPTTGSRLFANFGDSTPAIAVNWADQAKMIISQKENSPAWKSYQAARND